MVMKSMDRQQVLKKREFENNKIIFYLIKIDQNEIKGNLDFLKIFKF